MTTMERIGRLIVFEGIDGTGKSTQLQLLGEYLSANGYPVLLTKEPTDGHFGKKIRELYNHRNKYSPAEELELFLADRREHVHDCLLPQLAAGTIIICDRYYYSTVAYQGARGFDPQLLFAQNAFAPTPDMVLLFTAPLNISLARITGGRGERLNNFEQREYLEQVSAIFASMQMPYIKRIDASAPINAVQHLVLQHVSTILPPGANSRNVL